MGTMRNPDTQSFLKRVEEYDSQRNSMTKPQVKGKPDHLSLERARQLLQGDSPADLHRANSNNSGPEIASTELAYRSAYNYEKSFSPERSKNQTSPKTFVISEEDYKLLQQLKSGDKPVVIEPKKHYPSRGRPRNVKHALEDAPSSPTWKVRNQVPEEAPSLPDRKIRSASPEEEAPSLPTRRVQTVEQVPLLPTRKYREPQVSQKEPVEKLVKDESSEIKEKKKAPPVPRKRNEKLKSEPTTFISSLGKNKLTVFPQVDTARKTQPVTTSHIDYLDSVHLTPKSPEQTKSNPQKPISPGTSGGSFISSALRTISPSPSQSNVRVEKPALPSKPAKLKNSTITTSKTSDNDELQNVKLKTTEKTKPKVPAKKDGLTIPRLRPVASAERKTSKRDDFPQNSMLEGLKKVERDKVQRRVVTPPEALTKMSQLKKGAANGSAKDEKTISEVETKLRGLKSPPPVPKRNISMPEALKKAEKLKNTKQSLKHSSKPSNENDFRSDLSAILTAPPKAAASSKQIAKESPNSTSSSLVHHTKSRARGPKRKLPTKIQ